MAASSDESLDRIAILGASRGLGRELAREIAQNNDAVTLYLSSRKRNLLEQLQAEISDKNIESVICAADFTKGDQQGELIESLADFLPTQIFYVAGGGPFGAFGHKNWQDHMWAYELNLLFPSKLLHSLLSNPRLFSALRQIVFVGSAVAENKPDPNAASYAASKHGLKGLIETVRAEQPALDVRLFSPGYMDTDMLPPHSWPRQSGVVSSARSEAAKLWQWASSSLD